MNPTNWSKTSTALLRKQTVRTAVSGYLIDQLYANVDVPGTAEVGSAPAAGSARRPALRRPAQPGRTGRRAGAGTAPRAGCLEKSQLRGRPDARDDRQRRRLARADQRRHGLAEPASDRGRHRPQLGLPASVADKLPPSVASLKIVTSSQLGLVRSLAKTLHALALWLTILTFPALCARDVPGPWVSAAHADVGRLEPRLRRRVRAAGPQDRTGSARLGDHQRRLDRTRGQRRLLGGHLAARAGLERRDHHRHSGDPRGAARGTGPLGQFPRGAFSRPTSASIRGWPTGSSRGCSPWSSSGGRSRRRATRWRC